MKVLGQLLGSSHAKIGAIAVAAATIHRASHGHISPDQIVAGIGAAVSLFGLGHKADKAEAFLLAVASDVARLNAAPPSTPPAAP